MMSQTKTSPNRRITHDRRKFDYTAYSPERRSGIDRRAVSNKMNVQVA